MRLPWGTLREVKEIFLAGRNFWLLGCLSFEERCRVVPARILSDNCKGIELLEIRDPQDAYPNYWANAAKKIAANRSELNKAGVVFEEVTAELLASEDELIDILNVRDVVREYPTIVLDITAMPKRFFCFLLKRILIREEFRNVVVTYTDAGTDGYATGHLAEDPMTCDHLPGFAAPLPPKGDTLVVSVGFESLSLRAILEVYRNKQKGVKFVVPFPPDGVSSRRTWKTLMEVAGGDAREIVREDVEVIAAWDAEMVFRALERWDRDSDGLTLAPFGPKPHSLAMALFGISHGCGLYYTQPKSYNPDYSRGYGETWAYVVKWDGMACFARPEQGI